MSEDDQANASVGSVNPSEERITSYNFRLSELKRFSILSGGLCTSICYSTFYTYSLTTNYMIDRYGFGQPDITAISTAGSVVGYFTFPYGILLDLAGPTPVLMLATFLSSFGALLFGITFTGGIAGSVVRFCVFFSFMAIGCTGFDNGSLVVVMSNFPLTRGPVVAIMKTIGGLGTGILGAIKFSILKDDSEHFMYFMAGILFGLGAIGCALIRLPYYHITPLGKKCIDEKRQRRLRLTERAYLTQKPPMLRFLVGVVMVVLLLIYLTTQSLCVAYIPTITANQRLPICIVLIILIVIMITGVSLPLPFLGGMDVKPSKHLPELEEGDEELLRGSDEARVKDAEGRADEFDVEGTSVEPAAPSAAAAAAAKDVGDERVDDQLLAEASLDPQYQTDFWHSIRSIEIWLLWWNCFVTWGCGLVVSLNSAQIYRSLNMNTYDGQTNTLYTAIIGVGNALGRLVMGAAETMLVRASQEKRPAITVVYPVSSASMVIGLIFLLALPQRSKGIVIGFFFEAFGNGFSWASTALTVRTLFAKDIGKHYSFMFSATMISIICLNRFGFGELYDREAKKQRASSAPGQSIYPRCSGKICVMYSLIILLCVNCTAVIGACILHFRYRRFANANFKRRMAMKEQAAYQQSTGAVDADGNLVEPLGVQDDINPKQVE